VVITQISDLELAIEQKGFEYFRISLEMSKIDIINNITQRLKAISKDTKNSQKNGKIWINKVSVWY